MHWKIQWKCRHWFHILQVYIPIFFFLAVSSSLIILTGTQLPQEGSLILWAKQAFQSLILVTWQPPILVTGSPTAKPRGPDTAVFWIQNTHKALYNTVHFNMVLYIKGFKDEIPKIYRLYRKITINGPFVYNINIFVCIQHGYFTNTVYAWTSTLVLQKRLWCIYFHTLIQSDIFWHEMVLVTIHR